MAPPRRQTRARKAAATRKRKPPAVNVEVIEPPVEESTTFEPEVKETEVTNDTIEVPVDQTISVVPEDSTSESESSAPSSSESSSSDSEICPDDDDVKIIESPYTENTNVANRPLTSNPLQEAINSNNAIRAVSNDKIESQSISINNEQPTKLNPDKQSSNANICVPNAVSSADKANNAAESVVQTIEDVDATRMFLKPIPLETTSEDIREYFVNKGFSVTDTYVPLKRGRPQGYGFVSFSSVEECNQALNMKSINFKGCRAVVATATGKAFSRASDQRSNVLFLRNLPRNCTPTVLRQYFKNTIDIRVMRSDTGDCRGIAFVEFSSYRLAQEAKKLVEDLVIDGRAIIIEYGKPKDDNSHNRSYNSHGVGSTRRLNSPVTNNNNNRFASRPQRDYPSHQYSRSSTGSARTNYNEPSYRKPPNNYVPPPRYPRDYHADRYYERDSRYSNGTNDQYDSYYQPPPPPVPSNSYYYDRPQASLYSNPSGPHNRGHSNPNYYHNAGSALPRRANYDREPDDYRRYHNVSGDVEKQDDPETTHDDTSVYYGNIYE